MIYHLGAISSTTEANIEKISTNNIQFSCVLLEYCIKESIQNAIHIIPEENDCSWVRGGQPSRQIIRNADYLKKCGYKYNGKLWIR